MAVWSTKGALSHRAQVRVTMKATPPWRCRCDHVPLRELVCSDFHRSILDNHIRIISRPRDWCRGNEPCGKMGRGKN
jgi:hypothetical protein